MLFLARGLMAFLVNVPGFLASATELSLVAFRYAAGPPTSLGIRLSALFDFVFQSGTPSTQTAVLPSLRFTNPLTTEPGGSAIWPLSPGTSPRFRASSIRSRCSGEKNSLP